jgi:hypothetical protein
MRQKMNYDEWVKTFENRTPEQLTGIINAIDTLEKDTDIKREYDDLGLFNGFSIRNAAKEVLKNKEGEFYKTVAQRVFTMPIARISEEYSQVNPMVITCPVTFSKVLEWIKELKTSDEILDTAGAIIDTVIDDTHLHYPDLTSKFIKEADLEPSADESECSILYGDSYYSLEDAIVEVLTIAFEKKDLALTYEYQTQTTPFYWDCECKDKFIHPKAQKVCFACNAVAADQPDSRVYEVVNAKLKGEI